MVDEQASGGDDAAVSARRGPSMSLYRYVWTVMSS
jgi:hypothetical protein